MDETQPPNKKIKSNDTLNAKTQVLELEEKEETLTIATRIKTLRRIPEKTSYNQMEKRRKASEVSSTDDECSKTSTYTRSIHTIQEEASDDCEMENDDNEFLSYVKKLSKLKQKKAEHCSNKRLINKKLVHAKQQQQHEESYQKQQEPENFLNPTLSALNYDDVYYCNFCGFSCDNTNKLLQHLFIHVFKCQLCSHFAYTKYDLLKHIYKSHKPSKELKVKRLVLEVTANDWYFLCSENEPHNINGSSLKNSNESLNRSTSPIQQSTITNIEDQTQPKQTALMKLVNKPLISSSSLISVSSLPEKLQYSPQLNEVSSSTTKMLPTNENYITKVKKFQIEANNDETKKDLEVIRQKYDHLKYKFECNFCEFKNENPLSAYDHLTHINKAHTFKCIACPSFSCDNLKSFKTHLNLKHKLSAPANKFLNEFFTIKTLNNLKIMPDHTLASMIQESLNEETSKNKSVEQSSHLKRALDENTSQLSKNIISNSQQQTTKKMRLLNTNLPYEMETLDNGGKIYVCSKCKLVYFDLNSLTEHTCGSNNINFQVTQNITTQVPQNDVICID